jgi:hypothetical protein
VLEHKSRRKLPGTEVQLFNADYVEGISLHSACCDGTESDSDLTARVPRYYFTFHAADLTAQYFATYQSPHLHPLRQHKFLPRPTHVLRDQQLLK